MTQRLAWLRTLLLATSAHLRTMSWTRSSLAPGAALPAAGVRGRVGHQPMGQGLGAVLKGGPADRAGGRPELLGHSSSFLKRKAPLSRGGEGGGKGQKKGPPLPEGRRGATKGKRKAPPGRRGSVLLSWGGL